MAFSPSFLLLIFVAFFLSFSSSLGDDGAETDTRKTFIIAVRNDHRPTVFSDVENWYTSILHAISSSTHSLESSSRGTRGRRHKPLYVYRTVFLGFSAVLTPEEADLLRSVPAVLDVLHDHPHQLHTTRSPLFLGLVSADSKPNRLLAAADSGSSVVIALIDTGIRPDHPSFADDGRLPPPPSRWNGSCDHGSHFPATSCNRKLVGARFFDYGYLANTNGGVGKGWDVFSPMDSQGHGTHTASTAAGGAVPNASFGGYAAGVASGIAPRARIAVYKACWAWGCFGSDIIAAIDAAVTDGADVISISIGPGVGPLFHDSIAISTLGAAERGVFVAASAGNEGPRQSTVGNVAPWITTVGAGAVDRRFPAHIILGDGTVVSGVSIHVGRRFSPKRSYPLVYAGNASRSDGWEASLAAICDGYLDPNKVRGKIVLCDRGELPRVDKGLVVKNAGGAAMILADDPANGDSAIPDPHVLPAVSVGYKAGRAIKAYISATSAPRVRLAFHGTQLGVKPAPKVAGFSARGPSLDSPHVIKPDLIAPGVSILAAWPRRVSPTGFKSDRRRTEFNIASGTSMSCPHVAGVAALLKAAHPDWSPAFIRSAMMTTAYSTDNMGHGMVDESTGHRSTEWAYGSGHVDPEKAVDPGLVYDLTVDDYVDFMCSSKFSSAAIQTMARRPVHCPDKIGRPRDLNYPSIAVVLEQSNTSKLEAVVHRTVTNVGEDHAVEYTVSVREPKGVRLVVEPPDLAFQGKGQKQGFVVKVSTEPINLHPGISRTEFGSVTWGDGKHAVRSPIAVTWLEKGRNKPPYHMKR